MRSQPSASLGDSAKVTQIVKWGLGYSLCLPSVRMHSLGQRSLSYAAPSVWNSLLRHVRYHSHLSNRLWNLTSSRYPTDRVYVCVYVYVCKQGGGGGWGGGGVRICFDLMCYMLQFREILHKRLHHHYKLCCIYAACICQVIPQCRHISPSSLWQSYDHFCHFSQNWADKW